MSRFFQRGFILVLAGVVIGAIALFTGKANAVEAFGLITAMVGGYITKRSIQDKTGSKKN